MVDYIFDVIKAAKGEDINITAKITDDENQNIQEAKFVLLSEDNSSIYVASGLFIGEDLWAFQIPVDITKDLNGRYWYYVTGDNKALNFKTPIYLV